MMTRKELIEQVTERIGGRKNIIRQEFRDGKLCVTIKDRSIVEPEALQGIEGVAAAGLNRSRLCITLQNDVLEEPQMAKTKGKQNYTQLAKDIISNVGGKENIISLRHCITRCRFTLRDESIAKDDVIKSLDGVVSVVHGGGEYMVVIGNEVVDVYHAVCQELGISPDGNAPQGTETQSGKKGNPVMNVLNLVMSAVMPALNLICAGGVLKGVLSLLGLAGLSSESGWYMLLNAMGDAPFYFLPLLLGYNLAKKLNADGFLGLIIGAIMVYPTLQGVDVPLFGMVVNATYTSSFLPVVLVVALAAPLSLWLDKHIPRAVSGFLVPVLTLLICIPLGFTFIGPAANAVGNGVNVAITALMNTVPVVACAVFAGLYQVMVLFGIHSALTSFSFMNVLTGKPDVIMALGCYCCFAQIGVVLAMYLKTKDEKLKSVALPAFLSGVFGVTEPAIYGVTLPRIKMFVISCIGAAIGGVFVALTGTVMYSFTGLGIMTILGMVSPENPNFVNAILGAVVPFVVSFAMAYALYRDEQ